MVGPIPNHLNFLNTKMSNVTWPTLFGDKSNVTHVMTLDPDNFGQILTGTLDACDQIFDKYLK